MARAAVILPPIVVVELVSGARREPDRHAIQALGQELPIHETPLEHWVKVGGLPRRARDRGLSVSTPDADVAQCAIDRDAVLPSRDAILARIASITGLRLSG